MDAIDNALIQEATTALREGKKPTTRAHRVYKKWQCEEEEKNRWVYYRSIPQHHWREMSGRAARIINDQAKTHGIPFDGKRIDLPSVVRALHDFLAKNRGKLRVDEPEDADLRLTTARARREELRLRREQGEVLDAQQVRKDRLRLMRWMKGVFDRAGSELSSQLSGRNADQVKPIVDSYFLKVANEIAGKTR